MKITYIYVLKCLLSMNVRYVGKANAPYERYRNHLNKCRDKNTHKRNWINSLRKDNLKPILEIIKIVPMNKWKHWEKYYIKYYFDSGCDLVNYTNGGDGLSFGNQTSFRKGNESWNKGTRLKKKCVVCEKLFEVAPSRYDYYKCCSRECGNKYKKINKNMHRFKKGHITWSKGRQLPKNTVNSKPVIQLDTNTGKIINRFPSAAEAERQLGIKQASITNNTCGRSKSAGGFKWIKEKGY